MTDWLDEIKWDGDGLLPAIAQDHETGEVLMVAWMNREALQLTAEQQCAVYWSRSRRKLWFKGEGRWNTGDTGDYELWANCLPWMYDAIERLTTYQEVLVSRRKFGVNNLVYNPFLSEAAALAQF